MNDIITIPAKLIKPSDLDERTINILYPDGIPDMEDLKRAGGKSLYGASDDEDYVDAFVARMGPHYQPH